MEYYSAVKRNVFESVLKRRMNLEPITQSEVSQKEKNKEHILTQIYGIYKNDTEEQTFRAAMEKQRSEIEVRNRDQTYGHGGRGGGRG